MKRTGLKPSELAIAKKMLRSITVLSFLLAQWFIFTQDTGGAAYPAAGWEAEWEKTVKAAEQESEVAFYTLGDHAYISEFEKKFPRIKVKIVSARGNELLSPDDVRTARGQVSG